jgi:hypothetical protein
MTPEPNQQTVQATPGPWRITGSGHILCALHGQPIASVVTDSHEGIANAHLIAAAPELRDALRMHHKWSLKNLPGYHMDGAEEVAYRATVAALAKAGAV